MFLIALEAQETHKISPTISIMRTCVSWAVRGGAIGITAVHITMHCANLNKGEKSANGSENDIEQCIQKWCAAFSWRLIYFSSTIGTGFNGITDLMTTFVADFYCHYNHKFLSQDDFVMMWNKKITTLLFFEIVRWNKILSLFYHRLIVCQALSNTSAVYFW